MYTMSKDQFKQGLQFWAIFIVGLLIAPVVIRFIIQWFQFVINYEF